MDLFFRKTNRQKKAEIINAIIDPAISAMPFTHEPLAEILTATCSQA